MRKYPIILLLTIICFSGYAQTNDQIYSDGKVSNEQDSAKFLHIRNITITGNKRTKSYIILRELHLKTGDSLTARDFSTEVTRARQQVYNTTLFTEVHIDPTISDSNYADLLVTVKEKWYIYPTPQFQLVDRNINEWLVKYKGDLSRVNYGVKFKHYNLSGRRDQLSIYLTNGYSRNISASYTNPYSNRDLTHGFSVGAGFGQFREIGYRTSYDNNILKYNTGKFFYNSWYVNASYLTRKAIRRRHIFTISYTNVKLTDSLITKVNPNYFNEDTQQKGLLDLIYTFQYTDVDNILYPTLGLSGRVTFYKRGLGLTGGVNMTSLEANLEKYYSLGRNWFTSFQLVGRIKLPFEQAFINQHSLGFGQSFLAGQEYYVIDAVAHAISKVNLKKQVAKFNVKTFFKSKTLQKIPFRILAKTYGNLGYAYNKEPYVSRLNNKLLYTGGFGLDIITFYDIQFKLEYSFNQLGERGFYIHNQSGF